ncbi:MAG: SPOR domain-containing protein [Gallionella sp.]|nr:SPOR domain-containing protein [Gallionella sp.]
MAKRLTDDEQNLRRKARRRLIGAVALTLAVVVVLPMVLDSEPKPAGQDIDLRIPDPDKAGEFIPGVAVPLEPVSTGMSATDKTGSSASAGSAVAIPPAPAAVDKEVAVAEAPGKGQPAINKPAKSSAVDKPSEADSESFVAQVGAYSNADTAKQELNKLKKWGFKAYTEKTGDTIRVRVGPYAEREKAEKARLLLEKHGLQPVVMSAK